MAKDDQPLTGIEMPHINDVLSGRGGMINKHAGNVTFIQRVKSYRKEYVNCDKVGKAKLSRKIYKEIKKSNPPGRFLKCDPLTKKWNDIGKKKALAKIRQALREGAPTLLKELKDGDGSCVQDREDDDLQLQLDLHNIFNPPSDSRRLSSREQLRIMSDVSISSSEYSESQCDERKPAHVKMDGNRAQNSLKSDHPNNNTADLLSLKAENSCAGNPNPTDPNTMDQSACYKYDSSPESLLSLPVLQVPQSYAGRTPTIPDQVRFTSGSGEGASNVAQILTHGASSYDALGRTEGNATCRVDPQLTYCTALPAVQSQLKSSLALSDLLQLPNNYDGALKQFSNNSRVAAAKGAASTKTTNLLRYNANVRVTNTPSQSTSSYSGLVAGDTTTNSQVQHLIPTPLVNNSSQSVAPVQTQQQQLRNGNAESRIVDNAIPARLGHVSIHQQLLQPQQFFTMSSIEQQSQDSSATEQPSVNYDTAKSSSQES